jgi:hypothetical protein
MSESIDTRNQQAKRRSNKFAITSTQLGSINENLVASRLMIESGGRLSPFQPLADDMGIDLLVYDKLTGHCIPLQIKSRTKTVSKHPKTVQFKVRFATFNPNQLAYVLAVLANTSEMKVKRAWLIPMEKLERISSKRKDSYVIRPSVDINSKDKFTPFRYVNMADVAKKLLDDFDSMYSEL